MPSPSAPVGFPPAYAAFIAANPPPVTTVDATGVHLPAFADCINWYQLAYQQVYGTDVYIAEDTQDGAWVALQALALHRANCAVVSAYNAFAPSTAQGVGLSRVVKVNGIEREEPSFSTAPGLAGGIAGTTVVGGIVSDGTYTWTLPTFTIDQTGQAVVTATCVTPGAVTAPAGSITRLRAQTYGWQSFTNTSPASPGTPVETDPQLKGRQALSTERPALGILAAIVGDVLALPNVTEVVPYENDGDVPDEHGLPGHSICLVVAGGDDTAVAQVIADTRPCCGTFGSTTVDVTDSSGIFQPTSFQRPQDVPLSVQVGIRPLRGYSSVAAGSISDAMLAYVAALPRGRRVVTERLSIPANLGGSAVSSTYEVEYIYVSRGGVPPGPDNVPMAFYERPTLTAANLAVQVLLQ